MCIILGSKVVYYFKQALSSFWHNGMMTIASLITVTSCLFLFAAFLLFGFNGEYIGRQIQSQCEIIAYVDIACSEAEANRAFNEIKNLPNVESATLETKDQALENYREFLGEDAIALDNITEDDFLRHSVQISMSDLSQTDALADQVREVENIAEVQNQSEIVNKVLKVTNFINRASILVMILLTFISIFIISNTIKLAVHARRREIHIMKFVGATDRFIRWPFMIEGMLVGFLGSLVALGVCLFGYNSLVIMVASNFPVVDLCSFQSVAPIVVGAVLIFGILMGMIGSAISVRRHLKV